MEKRSLLALVLVIVVLMVGAGLVVVWNLGLMSEKSPLVYGYTVVEAYPHDTSAFTEGLVIDNGVLYESAGGYGASVLRRVDLVTGEVLAQVELSDEFFGEGLAMVDGLLVQLTWESNVGFIYDEETLSLLGNFTYSTDGWGLTYDGNELIMSDGTSKLYFLDPVTYQKTGEVTVYDGETLLERINELEFVNGDIYANIWYEQKIAIINPETGQVKGYIDLNGIYQASDTESTLNGIAYDQNTGKLYVTGKNWPNLYQITIKPKN
jgi:glutamine cyclotransferase